MSRGRSGKRGFPDDGWGGMGGYMKAKAMKLDNQFEEAAPRSKIEAGISSTIFKGVSIYVNGYTDPPAADLKKMMMTHGGRYIYYPNKTNTTHIVASNLAYTKIKELKNEKVVTPDWITDSIKAGKLLPHASYLLYRPKASNQTIHRYAAGNSSSGELDTIADRESVTSITDSAASSTRDASDSKVGNSTDANKVATDHSILSPGGGRTMLSDPSASSMENDGTNLTDRSPVLLPHHSDNFGDNTGELVTIEDKVPNETFKSSSDQSSKSFPKSSDPSFIAEFYSNSRLHHISTWGAEYKAFVNELQRTGDRSFPGRERLRARMEAKSKDSNEPMTVENEEEEEFSEMVTPSADTGPSSKQKNSNQKESERVIMHIDMDCFFVSVGLLSHPELRGKPVAVTHSKGKGAPTTNEESRAFELAYYEKKRGIRVDTTPQERAHSGEEPDDGVTDSGGTGVVMKTGSKPEMDHPKRAFNSMAEIASCSYEARQAGVKNGMFMGPAMERCPELVTVPYDFDGYQRVSRCLYETVASYTHDIEAVSCDEMLVDISSIMADTGAEPLDVAGILREDVFAKTGCHASTGIASNILLARLSTRKAKPNGMFHLRTGGVEEFMTDISVRDLPGVGWSTHKKLQEMGLTTCSDLQHVSLSQLQKEFGPKTGQQLYAHCRGKDDRPIRMERERKSVSAEVNYGIRFKGEDEAIKFITDLATEVHKRLHNLYMVGRTITLKLKVRQPGAPKETSKFMGHGVCDDRARSVTLGQETDDLSVIQRESRGLFLQIRAPPEDVRGVGIQISRLKSKGSQPSASKSLVDMLPKKADMAQTAAVTSPRKTGPPKQPNMTKMKQKPASLLDFVQKTGGGGAKEASPAKEPTLPRLPTLDSPPSNEKPRLRGVVTPRVPPPHGVGFSLPSPSQLDLSVLNSLPEEIKKQILQEYKHSGAFKERPPQSRPDPNRPGPSSEITQIPDRPGPSSEMTPGSSLDRDVLQHLPPEILQEVLENQGKGRATLENTVSRNLGPVEELPSFSQIDQSCLDALPEDIRNEITAAHQRRQPPATKPSKMSPSKQASPFKIARRKGRPKKASPSKLPWQRNILEAMNIQESPSKSRGVNRRLIGGTNQDGHLQECHQERFGNAETMQRPEEGQGLQGTQSADGQEGIGDVRNEEAANLAGAVKLEDIKALLREWTGTFKNPLEDDIGMVVQYLRELILERNLEMVHLVLRGLKRIVGQSDSRQWVDACQTITRQVQSTVQQFYGSTLKLQ